MSNQPPSLPGVDWSAYAADELSTADVATLKVYTGEGLRAHDPTKYEAVVQGLLEGIGHCALARLLHVSTNTIAAIEEREMARPEFRQAMGERATMALGLAIKRGAEAAARAFLRDDLSAVEAAKALSILSSIARPTDGGEKNAAPAGRESNDYLDVADGLFDGEIPAPVDSSVGAADGAADGGADGGADGCGSVQQSDKSLILRGIVDGDTTSGTTSDNVSLVAPVDRLGAADVPAEFVRPSAGKSVAGRADAGANPGGGGHGAPARAPLKVKCIHGDSQGE